MEDSGVGSAFIEGVRNAKPQTFLSPNLRSEIIPQTFISVKPSYAWFGHYSLFFMVCQAHFMQKKSPKTRENFARIVIFFYKTIMKYLENQDKWFVIYHRVNWVYFESPLAASLTGLSFISGAGDEGKKALRVTTLYNIPHRAPIALSNPIES